MLAEQQDDIEKSSDSPAKRSNQEQTQPKNYSGAKFDDIDLDVESEDSPEHQEPEDPAQQNKIITDDLEDDDQGVEQIEEEEPKRTKSSKRKASSRKKSTTKKSTRKSQKKKDVPPPEEESVEPEDETIGMLVDKPVEHEVAPEEEVDEDGDVKAEDEEEQIEQSAAEPGALTDEEMVEADDENIIEDEPMKDEEEQIEASDEEEAAPAKGKQSKKSKKSNKASGKSSKVKDSGRGKRKAGESANLFINVASSILAEDYGQEIGDDEEEGEYEPPSQVSSESFPAASDSNMVSEEFQIGEQASAAAPLAHDEDNGEDFAKSKNQQSQKSQKPASKKKSEKQAQSQKSLRTSKAGSKEKILNQSLSQNVDEMARGRQSRSKLSQRSQKEQTASLVATRKPTPRRTTRGAPEGPANVSKKDLKAIARSSSRK